MYKCSLLGWILTVALSMMWSTGVLFLTLLPFSIAKPLLAKRWDDFEVKHAWADTPKGWTCHGPAPADHTLDMRIALKQDRFDELLTALYEVSEPSHERYEYNRIVHFLVIYYRRCI